MESSSKSLPGIKLHRKQNHPQGPLPHVLCCAKSLQSSPTLCDPMDHSPPGSSVHWMLQARILEWVSFPFSRWSSRPRDQTNASSIAGGFFTAEPPGKSLPSLVWMITQMRSELPVTAAWPPDIKHYEPRDNLEGGFVGTKSGASERNWMPGNTREQPVSAFSQ